MGREAVDVSPVIPLWATAIGKIGRAGLTSSFERNLFVCIYTYNLMLIGLITDEVRHSTALLITYIRYIDGHVYVYVCVSRSRRS